MSHFSASLPLGQHEEKGKMPIPAYLWLKDDGGADIKGSVDVHGQEIFKTMIHFPNHERLLKNTCSTNWKHHPLSIVGSADSVRALASAKSAEMSKVLQNALAEAKKCS